VAVPDPDRLAAVAPERRAVAEVILFEPVVILFLRLVLDLQGLIVVRLVCDVAMFNPMLIGR